VPLVSHDLEKVGPDQKHIALDDPDAVRIWCRSLGCTEEELRLAVQLVGNSADQVPAYFRGMRKS
jgi:hypothetical protein